jgi:hypothetical protein
MPLSIIYRGHQFYWWRKPEYSGNNHQPATSHRQTFSHTVVLCTHRPGGVHTHNTSKSIVFHVSDFQHWFMLRKTLSLYLPVSVFPKNSKSGYLCTHTHPFMNSEGKIWGGLFINCQNLQNSMLIFFD